MPVFIFSYICILFFMQKLIKTLISNCPEDTIQFAKDLSKTIPYGSTVFMVGDLGSGKTTFTKGFAQGLGFSNEVQSPTYPILNEYSHSDNFIYHFDLYRLKSVSEFLEIGGIEYLSSTNGICIIEWPELINSFDIVNKFKIFFKVNNSDSSRTIEVYK
ncbi:MAG: tRNA (adenosine(37)-N6)-threonylcarbamoyltransferase complex ATPase subunit type 1 TsaE [Candidatus Marinimicrobia bacterium]|nr:tRNA (adenosine(37)-N6)-threonylcarbamoyltransferase complex ATPase subunit type 1 TsaE [Candidatus Neomarinimicrobiota bacterium]